MHCARYCLFLLAFGLVAPSYAQISAYACNDCSDVQFEQLARTIGVGEHYLYDFNMHEIRLYDVDSPALRSPPGGDLIVTQLSVPLAVQQTFDTTNNLWEINHGALGYFDIPVTLDPNDPALPVRLRDSSAWDIALIESRQFDLQQYLTQDWNPSDGSLNQTLNLARELVQKFAVGDLAKLIFGSNPFAVTFVVTMPGGGTVRITYDHTHNGHFWYRTGESRDSENNLIPEKPDDMAWNVYEFQNPFTFDKWGHNPWGVPWPVSFCTQVACVIVHDLDETSESLRTALGEISSSGADHAGDGSIQLQPRISCQCAW